MPGWRAPRSAACSSSSATIPRRAELQAALARTLRDPSLTLAYWLPEFGSYADLAGRPVPLPLEDERRAVRLIEREGGHVAALLHDPSLDDEPELLDAVTAAAGIALENARLQAELGHDCRSCGARASASSRPGARSGSASSATCTMGRSSG